MQIYQKNVDAKYVTLRIKWRKTTWFC